MKRLRKSSDSKIAGVCGGLSEYINPHLDPLLVRVIWVLLSVVLPPLVLLYFILGIALPDPVAERAR
ncbi:MAG: PspC domain-containing protein [Mangrovibacterium sp.]